MRTQLLVLLFWLPAVTGQTTNSTTFVPVPSPPTVNPVNSSTVPPLSSLSPSGPSSSFPSLSPIEQPILVNETISGLEIQFENVPPLINLPEREQLWENVTRDFFTQFYFNNDDVGIRNFTTTISFESQDSVLRGGVIVTTFNYSQTLEYIILSVNETEMPSFYAVYPLSTAEGNAQYAADLVQAFAGWENLRVPILVPLLPGMTRPPTIAPSAAPSVSLVPTAPQSTSAPTLSPTRSLAPSEIPSILPSQFPSESAASAEPSSVPSMAATSLAPSAEEIPIEIDLLDIEMRLDGGGALEADEIELWQEVTAEWFANYFSSDNRRRLQDHGVQTMITEFTFVRQEPDNTIVYHQYMAYSASAGAEDPETVAVLPFTDEDANMEYGTILQSQFANMEGLILPLQTPVVPDQNATSPIDEIDDSGGLSRGAFIGIIAAGAAVLLVCVYVTYSLVQGCDDDGDGNVADEQQDNESELSPQFHITSDEDISTLDDPYMTQKQRSFENKILDVGYGDQRYVEKNCPCLRGSLFFLRNLKGTLLTRLTFFSVATVDYDYSKAYGGGDTSVVSSAGGTMGDTRLTSGTLNTAALAALGAESQFRDSGIHEQVLVIVAPAGKLGVVIDTPDDGAPVVHAVKDTSVIADRIQVGDKLVAVDDEDVRSMTAIRVSKLISKKSNNPSRKLTIIRTTTME